MGQCRGEQGIQPRCANVRSVLERSPSTRANGPNQHSPGKIPSCLLSPFALSPSKGVLIRNSRREIKEPFDELRANGTNKTPRTTRFFRIYSRPFALSPSKGVLIRNSRREIKEPFDELRA